MFPSFDFLRHSRYSSFSTMSSIFGSALGVGGSNFGCSIQQPMVEWEVVLIGDYSLEESPHEASDSESSFFKRLMKPSHVSEGSS